MKFATFTLLFGMLVSTAAVAQDIDLRYAFRKGVSYRYKQVRTEKAMAQSRLGFNAEMNRETESFFTVSLENINGDDVVLRITQDTALVEDKSPGAYANQGPDIPNAITRKPILITLTSKGILRSMQPTVPLRDTRYPEYLTDNVLARSAMIFPVLPSRALANGLTWTETQADTARPSQNIQGLGQGNGLRISSVETRYEVGRTETVDGYNCLTLSWTSSLFTESKMIYAGTEIFNEDRTKTTGTLSFAPAEGIPIAIHLTSSTEATRVVFGKEDELNPSSTETVTTLRLIK
jgi:hypothetical protein